MIVRTHLSFDKELRSNDKWLLIGGSTLIIVGIPLLVNFYLPLYLLNWVLTICYLIVSAVTLTQAFKFWFRKPLGFVLHLLGALLYLIVAAVFFANTWIFIYPALPILLVLFLISFTVLGTFRIYIAYTQVFRYGWLWTAYCGIINIISVPILLFCLTKFPFAALLITTGADVLATGVAFLALGIFANQRFHQ